MPLHFICHLKKKPASWDTNSVLGFFLVSNAANCALNLGQLHDGFMM